MADCLFSFCSVQDYAETTMNELLGWYGYGKAVDSEDTDRLDLKRFAASQAEALTKGQGMPLLKGNKAPGNPELRLSPSDGQWTDPYACMIFKWSSIFNIIHCHFFAFDVFIEL